MGCESGPGRSLWHCPPGEGGAQRFRGAFLRAGCVFPGADVAHTAVVAGRKPCPGSPAPL